MIIQDHTEALCLQLKDDYEEQVQTIITQAETEAENIIAVKDSESATRAAKIIESGVITARKYYAERLLAASYAAKQAKEAVRQAYLEQASKTIEHSFDKLSQRAKNHLAKKLYEDLKATIKKEGYKEEEFTFAVYKGLKVSHTKPAHHDIKVTATSGHLVFEDSLIGRLAQEQDKIRQTASELIN